jgi:hypothetical protein
MGVLAKRLIDSHHGGRARSFFNLSYLIVAGGAMERAFRRLRYCS